MVQGNAAIIPTYEYIACRPGLECHTSTNFTMYIIYYFVSLQQLYVVGSNIVVLGYSKLAPVGEELTYKIMLIYTLFNEIYTVLHCITCVNSEKWSSKVARIVSN